MSVGNTSLFLFGDSDEENKDKMLTATRRTPSVTNSKRWSLPAGLASSVSLEGRLGRSVRFVRFVRLLRLADSILIEFLK